MNNNCCACNCQQPPSDETLYTRDQLNIMTICMTEYDYFLNIPGVVGCGLGYMVVNGVKTNISCILVLSMRCNNALIPTTYKGYPTQVRLSSPFKYLSYDDRVRPVPGGYVIGPISSEDSGTLGCVVRDNSKFYILSCNHVLTNDESAVIGTPILQPSAPDGGTLRDQIAKLSKYIPIQRGPGTANVVDCAIAEITNFNDVTADIEGVGFLSGGTELPVLNRYVRQVGYVSELLNGLIEGIGVTIVNEEGEVFVNQILTSQDSEPGDSGAILFNPANKNAVGLLMAYDGFSSVYNPIQTVLSALNVRILAP